MKYTKLLEIALALMPEKRKHEYFHVAFILNKRKIISIGWNDTKKSHTHMLRYPYRFGSMIHAEFSALYRIRRHNIKWNKLTIVVMRLDRDGKLKMSKPCCGCEKMIISHGIKSICFSTDDGIFEKMEILE